MKSPVCPELPTASVGSSQAPTAAVDNSAPCAIRPESTYNYRNYIHPEKERSRGVDLNEHDSGMFWEVTKSLAHQLLVSVSGSAKTP